MVLQQGGVCDAAIAATFKDLHHAQLCCIQAPGLEARQACPALAHLHGAEATPGKTTGWQSPESLPEL